MQAAAIAAALGDARREGRNWRCRCPLHGGRSLVLTDGDGGRVLVTCWGGCDRRDVLVELQWRGLLDDRRKHDGAAPQSYWPKRPVDAERGPHGTTQALRLWNEARPAVGTIVERYLRSRAIDIAPPSALRFHPRCPHPSGIKLPAMMALVEREGAGPVALHRTFLRPDGSGKADIETDKASLGPVGGGAVRFGKPREYEWLGVAEGIETALAVVVACGIPVWAALSASGIRSLVLPPEARMVLLCADHDKNGVGQWAAQAAAQRFLAEGRRVRIALPPLGSDFNDVLCGTAPDILKEALHVA